MSDTLKSNENPTEKSLNNLRTDQEALTVLREKFGQLENFQAFETFISSSGISGNERIAFNNFIQARVELDGAEEIIMDIEFGDVTLPTNRETFAFFAAKF